MPKTPPKRDPREGTKADKAEDKKAASTKKGGKK